VLVSNAAIYAWVSSARQKEQETIGSQTAALRRHAEQLGLEGPEQWVFEDDGQSGASLVRPALDRLRDLVCQVPVDVLLVYSRTGWPTGAEQPVHSPPGQARRPGWRPATGCAPHQRPGRFPTPAAGEVTRHLLRQQQPTGTGPGSQLAEQLVWKLGIGVNAT